MMDTSWNVVHTLALRLDPTWRRLPEATRREDVSEFLQAARAADDRVQSHTYSMVGLRADADLMFWRLGPTLTALEETAAGLLRAGLGRSFTVAHAMVGLVRPSQYVTKATPQEQAMFSGTRAAYLIVYPFVKTSEWYASGREDRQRMMHEHIKVGHGYPMIRQMLAYSFGLDDQEFIVAYETDDLAAFQDLVHALRATEGRRYTQRDTPILVGIHRPLADALALLGAPVTTAQARR